MRHIIEFIIVIVVIIVVRFFMDLYKQKKTIKKQGGMLLKYAILKEGLNTPGAQIYSSSDNMTIRLSNVDGFTEFYILQTFQNVDITWTVKSLTFGNYQKNWTFPECMDQYLMLSTIGDYIQKHNQELFG